MVLSSSLARYILWMFMATILVFKAYAINLPDRTDYVFSEKEHLKYEPIDYTQTPIYSKISKKNKLLPEYQYLDSVDIFRTGQLSDSIYLSGFMVKPKKEGKYPVIIYCRGGNSSMPPLKVADAVIHLAPLANEGYVVIGMNHRGAEGCEGKDEFGGRDLQDILNLREHLGEWAFCDTTRVGLVGLSRGGMSVYLALKKSHRFQAAVVISGIADCFQNINNPDHAGMMEVYQTLIPDFEKNREENLRKRSAVKWADSLCKTTPLLILHGADDKKVKVKEAQMMHEELSKIKFNHAYIEYEKDGHGLEKNKKKAEEEIFNWFSEKLK